MTSNQAPRSISASLLPEYDHEMAITRKHLKRVPDEVALCHGAQKARCGGALPHSF